MLTILNTVCQIDSVLFIYSWHSNILMFLPKHSDCELLLWRLFNWLVRNCNDSLYNMA